MKINIREIVEADENKIGNSDSIDEAFDKLKSGTEVKAEPEVEAESEAEETPKIEGKSDGEETSEIEGELETEEALKIEGEREVEEIPEVEAEPEPEEASEVKAEPKTEETPETDVEPEAETETERKPAFALAKAKRFIKEYGWVLYIALSIVLMFVWAYVAMNMIPRQVNATINGTVYTVESKAYTIDEFLEEENIHYSQEDYINKPLSTIIYDGINFEITHATDFTVKSDGKVKKYKTLSRTVKYALEDCDIHVGKRDIVLPDPEETISDNMRIVIQRVTLKRKTVEEEIPYSTEKKDDSTLNEGTTKVVTEGKPGKAKVTYEITYIDGKMHAKRELAREVLVEPVNEIVAEGTRINYNGKSYSRKLVVKAYSYTGGGTTAMGTRARVGEIAVDPRVIPLGTNVYIEGVGPRRAEDTGGNIKGNTIDIYMNSRSECVNWGVRYVTIYIQ